MSDRNHLDRAGLDYPHRRKELLLYLDELSLDDPRAVWRRECEAGLTSGIDAAVHFFFDDHDFDQQDIGSCLTDEGEVEAVGRVKRVLDAMIIALPNGNDDDFFTHNLWPLLKAEAKDAAARLRASNPTGR